MKTFTTELNILSIGSTEDLMKYYISGKENIKRNFTLIFFFQVITSHTYTRSFLYNCMPPSLLLCSHKALWLATQLFQSMITLVAAC
jgi:hypothetical protein